MSKALDTCHEINSITAKLIELSLSIDQNFSIIKNCRNNQKKIGFGKNENFSIILKNVPYSELYAAVKEARNYNLLLVDGALVQIQYTFKNDIVTKHRLAFLPSPDLTQYQNDPQVYEADMNYAENLDNRIVPTPIRFDFDKEAFISLTHPMSHLTIGQYKNCRIPVKSAISPFRFFEFILGSFYNTAFNNYRESIQNTGIIHPETIDTKESLGLHINLEI